MKALVFCLLYLVAASGCSIKIGAAKDEFARKSVANAICADRFGNGVKSTHYYYTGEPRIIAIGLHCGNNPYKQNRIKISRDEWEQKLNQLSNG